MPKKTDLKEHIAPYWNTQTEQQRITALKRRHGLAEPAARLIASLHFGERK